MNVVRRFVRQAFLVFVALFMATLAFVTAGQAATTLIWVAGTQAPYYQYPDQDPNNLGQNGLTDPIFDGVDQVVGVPYDRTMGLITYPGAPLYDDSVAGGVNNVYATIVDVRTGNPMTTIRLTGVSQGADVIGRAVHQLEVDGFDTSNMVVILQGNPASTVGGIKTALPFGYVPFLGMTLGQATSITRTPVIQVRNQYDLATDVPQFFNPLALANVLLGFALYHTHEYTGPLNDPSYIYTTNESGLVTDVFRPYTGIVPLLRPLEMLGVPTALLQVINQPVKDLIELGYDRSFYGVPGAYPDEPVRMSLVPPLHLLIPGLAEFVTDSLVAVQQLVAMATPSAPNPAPAGPSPVERNIAPMAADNAADISDSPTQVKSEPSQQPEARVLRNDSPTSTPPASQLDKSEQPESVKPSIGVEPTGPKLAEKDSSLKNSGKLDEEQPKEKVSTSTSTSAPSVMSTGNKFEPGDTVQQPSTKVKDDDPVSPSKPELDVSTPSDNSQSTETSVGGDSPGSSGASASGASDGSQSSSKAVA